MIELVLMVAGALFLALIGVAFFVGGMENLSHSRLTDEQIKEKNPDAKVYIP